MASIIGHVFGKYNLSISEPGSISKYGPKWHSAFLHIYCSIAFLPKHKRPYSKLRSRKPQATLAKPTSFTTIPIDDGDDQDSTFSIEPTELTSLVREKKLDRLRELGGVEALAPALQTDISAGINGDLEDVSRRHRAFGFNTYERPSAKGFFHFVVEAFRDLTIVILLGCAALSLAFGIKENGIDDG